MKILFATMQFGRGYGQGTERYLSTLGGGLCQRGHEVAFLAGDPEHRGVQAAFGECVEEEPIVRAFPTCHWLCHEGAVSQEDLQRFLIETRPDVLHVANPAHIGVGIISAAQHLGIPVVVTMMDYWWVCPKHTLLLPHGGICDAKVSWRQCVHCMAHDHTRMGLRHVAEIPILADLVLPALYLGKSLRHGMSVTAFAAWTQRRTLLTEILQHVAAVIFPSAAIGETISEVLGIQRGHHIPYGLESRWFQAGDVGPRERRHPDELVIGFAGRLAPYKGLHVLLEALQQLGWRSQVRIAGDGADAQYHQRLASLTAGLKVQWLGWLDTADMPEFYHTLDVVVVPSLWPENLPITLLEAQAIGIPVLGSAVAGIAEAIPEPAHRFAAGSAEALARCLRVWADGTRRAAPCGVQTADQMIDATLKVYGEVWSRA